MAMSSIREELILRIQSMEKELREWKDREADALLRVRISDVVLEDLSGLFFLIDESLRLVRWNRNLESLSGYGEHELKNMFTPDLFKQRNQPLVQENLRSVLDIGEAVLDLEILNREGHSTPYRFSARRVESSGDRFVAGMGVDLSDIREVEQTLAENENRYRALSDATFEAVFFSRDGITLDVNRAATEIFGYSREEFMGMYGPEMFAPEYREIVKQRIAEGDESPYEAVARKKDGTEIFVEIRAKMVWYQNQLTRTTAIRDIDQQKKMETALEEQRRRFQVLVEQSPMGISVLDSKDRYRYVNTRFTEIFGYSLDDIPTGKQWWMKAYPDSEYRRKVIRSWKEDLLSCSDGKPEALQRLFRVVCKDGTEKMIQFKAIVLDEGNTYVFCDDITDKEKLEAHLRQAQKMEAIGTLAGGLAHDFNNLLMGILGRTSLMAAEVCDDSFVKEHIRGIEACVDSASKLTQQLLGVARGGKYEVRPHNLNEIVQENLDLFGRTRKEIRIHRELSPDLWTVEVDGSQIGQTLLNLFVNAWQAMPDGGDLTLKTENRVIDVAPPDRPYFRPGKYAKVSVTDTGMGMEKEIVEKIFDPFFTTKERGRGTGLGLASAYGIIKNHGGHIDVASVKGSGSTFSIYLPFSGKPVSEDAAQPHPLITGTETILLVDDEDICLDVAKGMLENLGYTVWVARSGPEAIRIFQSMPQNISLVLLDMIMPDMSGAETFEKLQRIHPEVKVILASGYSIDGQAMKIMDRGCKGFIQKPFTMTQISVKIREIIDKEQTPIR